MNNSELLIDKKINKILETFYKHYSKYFEEQEKLIKISNIKQDCYLQTFKFFELFDIKYLIRKDGGETDEIYFLDSYLNKVVIFDNGE
jgi:hypothetical protein